MSSFLPLAFHLYKHRRGSESVCGVTYSHWSDHMLHTPEITQIASIVMRDVKLCVHVSRERGAMLCNNALPVCIVQEFGREDVLATAPAAEEKEYASWHSALQVFPARSWPRPQSEDCLLRPCQQDTVSNRAAAARVGQLHSSQNLPSLLWDDSENQEWLCGLSGSLGAALKNVWRIMSDHKTPWKSSSLSPGAQISVGGIYSSRLGRDRHDVIENTHSHEVLTMCWSHPANSLWPCEWPFLEFHWIMST